MAAMSNNVERCLQLGQVTGFGRATVVGRPVPTEPHRPYPCRDRPSGGCERRGGLSDTHGYPDHFLFSAALYVEAETIIIKVIMAAEIVELFFGLPPKAGIAC
jgi:hypothetical protein